jgi:hypothetical protein
MLHFRIAYQHEIKAFLVEYDSDWSVIANKTSQLFEVPAKHVVLVHKHTDGKVVTLGSHEDLREYILGPRSARAVAVSVLFDISSVHLVETRHELTFVDRDCRWILISRILENGNIPSYPTSELLRLKTLISKSRIE